MYSEDGDMKGELLAACSNLFALFLYYINPILQSSTAHPQGQERIYF